MSFSNIVKNVMGWERGSRVCVVAGREDKIVSVPIAQKTAELLKAAVREQRQGKKLEGPADDEEGEDGVSFVVVEKGPHHFQNDLVREDAARQVLEFLHVL